MALTRAQKIEKNRVATTGADIILLELQTDPVIRICNDNDDYEWGGYTWIAIPIKFGSVNYDGKELPTISLEISNVNKQVGAALALVDGGSGTFVTCYVVNTKLVNEPPMQVEYFKVKDSGRNSMWCNITLGCEDEAQKLVHTYTVNRNFCQHIVTTGFKGIECAYNGSEESCNGMLERCRELNNAERFKGMIFT